VTLNKAKVERNTTWYLQNDISYQMAVKILANYSSSQICLLIGTRWYTGNL